MTKKVFIIFRNPKDYASHLIVNEIEKFNVKVDVIHNGLKKYMAFTINKNLVFTGSKEFINFVINDDFKYLTQEFGSENLKLLKQKDSYPYEYIGSFDRFSEK